MIQQNLTERVDYGKYDRSICWMEQETYQYLSEPTPNNNKKV